VKPGRERRLVTSAVMMGMFLAALEATAVAPALPTAVGEMGGVARLSWVFSAYLLTSTTTVPLYGKLADLFGRRRIYHVAVALFLLGSALSGMAGSIGQLIVFRAIQGLGAGGVNPVAITIVADIYTLEERGRMQGLFSGVWAFASLVGPFLGGVITELFSWRWIFYLNIPFGIASAVMLQRYLSERKERRAHRLDVLGTISLTAAVTLLLLVLTEGHDTWGWSDPRTLGLLAASAAILVAFFWQEGRAPEPMLPLELFKSRVIAVSSAGNVLIGALLYSITAYVPMFAQAVLGGSPIDAGTILAPILVGWPIASTLSGRLMGRVTYRRLSIGGGLLLVAGGLLLARAGTATTRWDVMLAMMVSGLGLGFLSMPFLLAVQSSVPWGQRGVATSTVQFFRNIGGAVGVAILGSLFNARLAAAGATGAIGGAVGVNAVLDPALRARLAPAELARLSAAVLHGLQGVYRVLAALAVLGLAVALLFPRGSAESLALQTPDPEAAR